MKAAKLIYSLFDRCHFCQWMHRIVLINTVLASTLCFSEEIIEPKLNLAYTINVAKFTKWPDVENRINICVSSTSKIYPFIKNLEPVMIDDHYKLAIKTDVNNFSNCQIVYWDDASRPTLSSEKLAPYRDNTLFITDSKEIAKLGFNIQYFVRNLKVRFHIDIDSVQEKNYQISSKLLRLSKNLN